MNKNSFKLLVLFYFISLYCSSRIQSSSDSHTQSSNILSIQSPSGTDTRAGCCEDNTITVTGQGKVSVKSDIAILTVIASSTSLKANDALQILQTRIVQINQAFSNKGVLPADVQTQTFSVTPQYNYTDGVQNVIGYTAQQTVTAISRVMGSDAILLGLLIDDLGRIQGVSIGSLVFDKADKSGEQLQARKLAFDNAKSKAQLDAGFAGRNLGAALTIIDQQESLSPATDASSMAKAAILITSVSPSKIIITYSVSIKYALTNK